MKVIKWMLQDILSLDVDGVIALTCCFTPISKVWENISKLIFMRRFLRWLNHMEKNQPGKTDREESYLKLF